jgi:hypothetical protein
VNISQKIMPNNYKQRDCQTTSWLACATGRQL